MQPQQQAHQYAQQQAQQIAQANANAANAKIIQQQQVAAEKVKAAVSKPNLDQLKSLNTQLWDRVHTMEFKLVEQLMGRKRDKKKFAKVLVRLAKYLSDQKLTPKQVKGILNRDNQRLSSSKGEASESDHADQDEEVKAQVDDTYAEGQDDEESPSIKPKEEDKDATEADFAEVDVKGEEVKEDTKGKSKKSKKSKAKKPKKKDPEATDSASEFDEDHTADPSKSAKDITLSTHMTLGEVSGRIPEQMLVSVDYQKFSKSNGFEAIDSSVNILTNAQNSLANKNEN